MPVRSAFAQITANVALQDTLRRLYGTVDRIDPWTGGLCEDHAPGAAVGPLFAAILRDQFTRTRDGDRFWHENGVLTADELAVVRGTTLSGLIARNTGITGLPADVFRLFGSVAGPADAGSAGDTAEVRSITGAGNNVANPALGATGGHVLTNYPLAYADGAAAPARADGPNPRTVSNEIHDLATTVPNALGITGLAVLWGQILDHDLGLTPGGTTDTIEFHAERLEGGNYPFVAEKLHLVLGHRAYAGANNVIARPIYLPALELAGGTVVNPAANTVVTAESLPGAHVTVAAGTLQTRTGTLFNQVLSITEVPRDRTPAVLPAGVVTSTVVTVQPAEMVFTTPAPLTLPNPGLAPGTLMELWSINPITGDFDVVGTGRVTADGRLVETVEGGIRNSSWHFFAILRAIVEFATHPLNLGEPCAAEQATEPVGSEVVLHSGVLLERHATAAYQSLGAARGLEFVYDSGRVPENRTFRFRYPQLDGDVVPSAGGAGTENRVEGDLVIRRRDGSPAASKWISIPLTDTANLRSLDLGVEIPFAELETGFYTAELRVRIVLYVRGELQASPPATVERWDFTHVNAANSPFGAGWGLAGLQRLVAGDDAVMLVDGDGSEQVYRGAGGAYTSPPGDFSTLRRLSDGSYTRTTTDRTVFAFDATGRLTSVTDRNGNATRYEYAFGRLARVTDPVGLVTELTYANSRLAEVRDPAGRVTRFAHDGAGDLTRITDPDGARRRFTYTAHRMRTETDQNGHTETFDYTPAGGAVPGGLLRQVVRGDTSVVAVESAQAQPLYNRNVLLAAVATARDAAGNVTRSALDKQGQLVSRTDGAGSLGGVVRNGQRLVTRATDGVGNRTDFTYDGRGNVTSAESSRFYLRDGFSTGYTDGPVPNQTGGEGWSGPWSPAGTNGSGNGTVRRSELGLTYPGLAAEPGALSAESFTGIFGSTSVGRAAGFPSSGTLYFGVLIAPRADTSGGNATFFGFGGTNDATISIGDGYTAGATWSLTVRDAIFEPPAFTNQAVANTGIVFVPDTTHYLVGRIDFDAAGPNAVTGGLNERIRLYVDPLPGAEPEVADAEVSVKDVGVLEGFGFWSQQRARYDEVRMGRDYADLFDPAADPTPLLVATQVLTDAGGAHGVAAADVTGDGRADLVHTNLDADTISVRPGTGAGTFGAAVTLATPDRPFRVEVADVNGDGRPDLVAVNLSNSVSVWLAAAGGGFLPRADYAVLNNSVGIAIGDLDNDGDADFVVSCSRPGQEAGHLTILLNDGAGGFGTRIDQALTIYPSSQIALADTNSDGRRDLVITNRNASQEGLVVYFGDGAGRFPTATGFPIGFLFNPEAGLEGLAVADVNGDGHADVAINRFEIDLVSVWLGSGAGTFPVRRDFAADARPDRVAFLDLTGDGKLDLVYSDSETNTLTVRPGDGAGNFGERRRYATGARTYHFAAADFDGDGDTDVVTGTTGRQLVVFRNQTLDPLPPPAPATGGAFRRTMTYDPTFSQLTSATDEEGRRTVVDIDPANGNARSVTRVVGQFDATSGETDDVTVRFTYTPRGQVDTATDPLGRVTDYDYDPLGRLISVTMAVGTPDEAVRTFGYDAAGNVTTATDENGNRTTFTHDAMNRVKTATEADPDGPGPLAAPVTRAAYDARGNLTRYEDAEGSATTRTFDARDRTLTATDAVGNVTRFDYDGHGNLRRTTDPLGAVTANAFDRRNRLVATTDPDGGRTRFAYDAANNLLSVTDPGGNATRYAYDFRNRLARETDPLGQVTLYRYDKADNLIGRTDRNGRATAFAYDDLDRLVTETWTGTGRVVRYDYDKASNLRAATDPDSSLAFTYDARDRVTGVDTAGTPGAPPVALTYGYDAAGNVTSVADSLGGETGYAYDALNRPVRLTQSGTGVAPKRVDMAYNALGQYASIARYADLAGAAPVAASAFGYDDRNRLSSLTHRNSAGTVAFHNFTYDADSRIATITDVDGPTTFDYDARDQLTAATHADPLNPDEGYDYDATGNRVSSHRHGTGYATGPGNRLAADGTHTYDYDDEGNLTRRTTVATGAVREFTWDHRNRLTRVTDRTAGGIVLSETDYAYDALNRRILKRVNGVATHFVYDREDVLFDLTGAARVRYLHGPGIDQVLATEDAAGNVRWHLTDHLGTVRDMLDGAGGLVNHLRYDSFGTVVAQTNAAEAPRHQFTGREYDAETGLHYYRARYYDAATGRFVGEDPIGFAGGDANLYRYVGNTPHQGRDPFGESEEDEVGIKEYFNYLVTDNPYLVYRQGVTEQLSRNARDLYNPAVRADVTLRRSGNPLARANAASARRQYLGALEKQVSNSSGLGALADSKALKVAGWLSTAHSVLDTIGTLMDPCSSFEERVQSVADTSADLIGEVGGPLGAAFAAGYGIGRMLDKSYGVSDRVSDYLATDDYTLVPWRSQWWSDVFD